MILFIKYSHILLTYQIIGAMISKEFENKEGYEVLSGSIAYFYSHILLLWTNNSISGKEEKKGG